MVHVFTKHVGKSSTTAEGKTIDPHSDIGWGGGAFINVFLHVLWM